MNPGSLRRRALAALRDPSPWDLIIVGGGATGLGAAVDAAARGYRTLLLEGRDFAAGTSSRSTKLIHGGVRYLRQGDLALVRGALLERARLLANAPHVVRCQPFVIPTLGFTDRLTYAAGLKLYDLLAGHHNIAPSRLLDRDEARAALPGIRPDRLNGGILYWDGQFDDARMAITLLRTATDLGATALNYLPVTGLLNSGGRIAGVAAQDAETGEPFEIRARAVVNATGVYADALRLLEDPGATALVAPSQGIHLVLDADFLPTRNALLIPETEDGRVLFAVPWQGKLLLGTTDTPRNDFPPEPQPFATEVDFLLRAATDIFEQAPRPEDVRSAFAGLRPLLRPSGPAGASTAALSREHAVLVGRAGMVTVVGGKWTTYRTMASETVDRAAALAGLAAAPSTTADLKLHGCPETPTEADGYGRDAAVLATLPGHDRPLHPRLALTEAMVRFAARFESARTVEDVLARRNRALFLDAAAAAECVPQVAALLAEERGLGATGRDALTAAGHESAGRYLLRRSPPIQPPR